MANKSSLAQIMGIIERNISEKVDKHISALRMEMNLENEDLTNTLIRRIIRESAIKHFPVTTDKLQKATTW